MKRSISSVLVVMLICSPVWSGPPPDLKHIQKVQKKATDAVKHHVRVAVETFDHRWLQGLVSEAQTDRFILTDQTRSTTLSYAEVKNINLPSHVSKPVLALVGAVVVCAALLIAVYLLGGLRG